MWYKDCTQPILALAPMADMTDGPFCRVCRELSSFYPELISGSFESQNVDLGKTSKQVCNDNTDFIIFREMVSSEAIVRENEKTLKMCEFEEIERPLVQQIFGATPDVLVNAAKIIIDRYKPDGIDVNMGCPVPKIAGKAGSGAALMKDQARAVAIVKELKNADLGVPVSVKTRLGWTNDTDILEFAKKIEGAGADLISIHGRTRKQGYSGQANWERIAEVKKQLSIPVLANGDIRNREDIERCLEVSGADGVMIGRGALGNPWIFLSRDKRYVVRDNFEEIISVVLKHAKLHEERYGSLVSFRKHLVYYFKELPSIREFRQRLVNVSNIKELEVVLLGRFSSCQIRDDELSRS